MDHMRLFKKLTLCFLSLFLVLSCLLAQDECTTAVVSGNATIDGRPLLWKNRDTDIVNNEVVYISGGSYDVVGVVNAGSTSSIWMGINSAGLAIENSYSPDLEGTESGENGSFMKYALQYCATVAEFEQLLNDTNTPGRMTKANFGVIDSTGAAAIFETGNHTYTKYDANDPATDPLGFIVRTNFGFTGDGSGSGYTRYDRALELCTEGILNTEMSHEYILRRMARDLKNDQIDPYPLPYEGSQDGYPEGYIRTNNSVNRYRTRSCAVFHGVQPGEDPLLSTMWVILGEPVCGIAVPIWAYAGTTPPEMNGLTTAPLSDAILTKKELCYSLAGTEQHIDTYVLDNGQGSGIFHSTLPLEDWIFAKTELALNSWRNNFPAADQVQEFEENIISQSFCCFITSTVPAEILYPPLQFTFQTALNRSLSQAEHINVLSWAPHPNNDNIANYKIYLIERERKSLLAEVTAASFEYLHRKVEQGRPYTYALVAEDDSGQESDPVCSCSSLQRNQEEKKNQADLTSTSLSGQSESAETRSWSYHLITISPDSKPIKKESVRKVHKPLNFSGQKILDPSSPSAEYINVLSWQTHPENKGIVKFKIYLINGDEKSLLAEINADRTGFQHRPIYNDRPYTYSLTAVDHNNRESTPVYTTVK